MAGRIRSIKPEVLEDEIASGLSDAAWRLWVSSWVLADDHGNTRAGSKYLAANVWQDTGRDVEAAVEELISTGRWEPYAVKGQRYAHIHSWNKHQRVDNAGKPRIPTQSDDDGTWNQSVTSILAESLGNPQRFAARAISPRDPDLRSPTPTPTPTNDPPAPPTAESATRVRTKHPAADVVAVFDAWVAARRAKHPRGPEPKLDESRATVIRLRLSEGHDVATLSLAVEGIWLSAFHLGENDRKTEYADIKHALGDAAKVEKFAELATRERSRGRVNGHTNGHAAIDAGDAPVPAPAEFIAVVKEFTNKKRVNALFDEDESDT